MANIKIGTFNVKGLWNEQKRRQIFQHLHQRQFDVICLQETHSLPKDEKYWRSLWGGRIEYSHGDKDSRGVLIMFKKKAPIRIVKVKQDKMGRRIICVVKYEDCNIMFTNLYTPNKDDPEFFLETFAQIATCEEGCINVEKVIVGDFNLVLDIEKDKIGGRTTTHNRSANAVKMYMEEEALTDMWRVKNPESQLMTWKVVKPQLIMEWLDYILISSGLLNNVKNEGISPAFKSDHLIPWIVISPSQEQKGNGFWRLNISLLAGKEYLNLAKDTIRECKIEKMEKVTKWEWVKYNVKKVSRHYSSQRNKSQNNKLLLYEQKLIQYNKELASIAQAEKESKTNEMIMLRKELLKQIDLIEKDREEIIQHKVRGAMLRARRDWLNFWGKTNKILFQFRKQELSKEEQVQN